jgi:hypothetical protein
MPNNLPGQWTGFANTPRDVLLSSKGVIYGRGVIDSAKAYDGAYTLYEDQIRAGTPLGQITASKLWVPCKRTTVTANGGATSANIPVVDARAFRAGDTISVGADTGLVIASVNYATNTITVGNSFTFANSEAVVAEDGSQTCRGILNEFVKLRDEDAIWRDKPFSMLLLAGMVDPNQILGDLAAIRADTSAQLSQILWGDRQGQV